MKKVYEAPVVHLEQFVANEYIAACGDTEYGVYKFECDGGGGVYGGLYDLDWNRISRSWNSYHACGETHDATTQDEFIRGYFDPDWNHKNGNEIEVYIWLETDRRGHVIDKHATEDLDREHWTVDKS